MYAQRQGKTSDIALKALHRQMVAGVCQLEDLSARCDAASQHEEAAQHLSFIEEVVESYVPSITVLPMLNVGLSQREFLSHGRRYVKCVLLNPLQVATIP